MEIFLQVTAKETHAGRGGWEVACRRVHRDRYPADGQGRRLGGAVPGAGRPTERNWEFAKAHEEIAQLTQAVKA